MIPEKEVWEVKAVVDDAAETDGGAGSHVQLALPRDWHRWNCKFIRVIPSDIGNTSREKRMFSFGHCPNPPHPLFWNSKTTFSSSSRAEALHYTAGLPLAAAEQACPDIDTQGGKRIPRGADNVQPSSLCIIITYHHHHQHQHGHHHHHHCRHDLHHEKFSRQLVSC